MLRDPFNDTSEWSAKGDLQARVMDIVKHLARRIDDDHDLRKQQFWAIPVTFKGLETRMLAARENYFWAVRSLLERPSELRARLIRATYIKESLVRLLREEWARNALLVSPVLAMVASGRGLPDVTSAEKRLARIEMLSRSPGRILTPLSLGGWARTWGMDLEYPVVEDIDIGVLIEEVKVELDKLDFNKITHGNAMRQHTILEIGFLRGIVGSGTAE